MPGPKPGKPYQSTLPLKQSANEPLPLMSQAKRVIYKFGGARALARALAAVGRSYAPCSIYRWTYPMPRGMGGLIPTRVWPDILLAARLEGVVLDADDFNPNLNPNPTPRSRHGVYIDSSGQLVPHPSKK